jgi:hypothetical protein
MQFITEFRIKELENEWGWPEIEMNTQGQYFSQEMTLRLFCEEELEIPPQYLKEIQLYRDEMHVTLCRDRSYIRDDWYVNLSRVSA